MKKYAAIILAIQLAGEEPPTEFRLFVSGWNETENGMFLFDEEAAASCMAAYAAWGVDVAIDLEHQMVNCEGPTADPTARDARGWSKLEVRNGELWCVGVTWTPDGSTRLREKRQRYVSPAFEIDSKTKRVTKIINVAITALPATHRTPALVAASFAGGKMDPKLIAQALDILQKGDAKGALEILKGIIAAAAGEVGETPADETAEQDPAVVDASVAPVPVDEAKPSDEDNKMKAAARVALAITGMADPGEAMAELSRRSKVAVDLEKREAQLSKDRASLESGERRALVGHLVKLGVEIPATAWSDDKGTVPCKRLASEPIEELRDRVQKLSAAGKPTAGKSPAKAPAKSEVSEQVFETKYGPVTLSARELRNCADVKAKPEVYAENKAIQQQAAAKRAG